MIQYIESKESYTRRLNTHESYTGLVAGVYDVSFVVDNNVMLRETRPRHG
jgi:hypothetical protein